MTCSATTAETAASSGPSPPRFWILAVAALVAGCPVLELDKPPFYCPTINILADAASVTRFRDGPGRDIIDVAHEGEIRDILAAKCEHDIDKDSGEGLLTVKFSLVIKPILVPPPMTVNRRSAISSASPTGRSTSCKRNFSAFPSSFPETGPASPPKTKR